MRLNKWLAEHSRYSRRGADALITDGRVQINGNTATVGQLYNDGDVVLIDSKPVSGSDTKKIVVLLNKPEGYVCSRNGQGAPTVYSLLPTHLHSLDIAGRLDKDSHGLVVLTNDGSLLHNLTHPSKDKDKVYIVTLDKSLSENDQEAIQKGVELQDGISALQLEPLDTNKKRWRVTMHQGRNRQIRRTFNKLDYSVVDLLRISVDDYNLEDLQMGKFLQI